MISLAKAIIVIPSRSIYSHLTTPIKVGQSPFVHLEDHKCSVPGTLTNTQIAYMLQFQK